MLSSWEEGEMASWLFPAVAVPAPEPGDGDGKCSGEALGVAPVSVHEGQQADAGALGESGGSGSSCKAPVDSSMGRGEEKHHLSLPANITGTLWSLSQ